MDLFKKILSGVRGFRKGIENRILTTMYKGYRGKMEELNIRQMLYDGVDSNGELIGDGRYSDYTIQTKITKDGSAAIVDHVTLRDEGDFHEGLFVRKNGKELMFGSTDEKTEKLEYKYGEDIFGLTEENKDEILDLVKEDIINDLRDIFRRR